MSQTDSRDGSVEISRLIQIAQRHVVGMWRYRWAALAVAWLLSIVTWGLVYMLPDRYEASAQVFVDTDTVLRPLLNGLSVEKDVICLYQAIHDTFGRSADVLINNAAYAKDGQLIGDESLDSWWKVLVRTPRSRSHKLREILTFWRKSTLKVSMQWYITISGRRRTLTSQLVLSLMSHPVERAW